MKKINKFLILLTALSFLYGCAAALIGVGAGVGVGAYKYIEGVLSREYPLDYSRAWDATNSALANLQISITTSMDEGLKGTIDAVRKDGKKIDISLKDRGQGVTTISVRVGLLGDRKKAERIHDEIALVSGIR